MDSTLTPTLRVISLQRVSRMGSREVGDDSFVSGPAQAKANAHAADSLGGRVVRTVEAYDESGFGIFKSPEWLGAIDLISRDEADCVTVSYFDRFGRDVDGFGPYMDALYDAGGFLINNGRRVDWDDPNEKLSLHYQMVGNMAVVLMSKAKAKETTAAMETRKITNRVPYGYMRNADLGAAMLPGLDKKTLVPSPDADNVRLIFQMRADGAGWQTIIDALHERDVPSPKGEPYWTSSSLSMVVGSRLYLGEVKVGEKPNRVWLGDAHEPLVSPSLWKAAQSKNRRVRTGRNMPGVAHGLLHCSGCGNPLQVQRSGFDRTFYGCRRRSSQGPCPAPVNGDQGKLDAYVDRIVGEAIDHGQLDAVVAQRNVSALKIAWQEAEADLEAWVEGSEGLKADAIKKRLTKLTETVERTKAAYHDALHASEGADDLPPDSASYLARDVKARQKIAQRLLDTITLQPFPPSQSKRGADPATRCVPDWN